MVRSLVAWEHFCFAALDICLLMMLVGSKTSCWGSLVGPLLDGEFCERVCVSLLSDGRARSGRCVRPIGLKILRMFGVFRVRWLGGFDVLSRV